MFRFCSFCSLLALFVCGVLEITVAQTAAAPQAAIDDAAWKFTLQAPAGTWNQPAFDASSWNDGVGGFGTRGTPNSRVNTEWKSDQIWLRKEFNLEAVPATPALLIFHDEDAEIYLNGKQVLTLAGYVTAYKVIELDAAAQAELKVGKNLLAVHCSQTSGGQFIDVHVIDANQVPELPQPRRPEQPFVSALITPWGEQVTSENAWQEYPRPAFARPQWLNLNGLWEYAIVKRSENDQPKTWDGQILVPFPLESKLSGVQKLLDGDEALWYQRSFNVDPKANQRTLLNFEAVDYRCEVFVNDVSVGKHIGGNVPFQFDVSAAIKPGQNQVRLRVEDDTEGWQLNGKQRLFPSGIFYTQVSGIWQSVWLETVPDNYLADATILTDAAQGQIRVTMDAITGTDQDFRLKVIASDGKTPIAEASGELGQPIDLTIPNAKLWSPTSPFLYDLKLQLISNNQVIDEVNSYAGIRSVGKVLDADGHWRMTLNGKILFHWGPLDQGWWPDGLLTPPSEEAMRFDVKFLQDAGFNMIRKHIKVEPRSYYTYCDQIGMLVWQDQVSAARGPAWTRLDENPSDAQWSDADHQQYMQEFEAMIDQFENHPSIVVWTPFNEAWGQHRTMEVGRWATQRDPSRLINIASGGNFWPIGDIVDHHEYPHPGFPFNPARYQDFVKVVGEFGGHGLPVDGHLWDESTDNWGYGGLPKNAAEYRQRYEESIRRLAELKQKGIAAGVYTQTTDVEGEINGLISYDRKVIKIPASELKEIHAAAKLID